MRSYCHCGPTVQIKDTLKWFCGLGVVNELLVAHYVENAVRENTLLESLNAFCLT